MSSRRFVSGEGFERYPLPSAILKTIFINRGAAGSNFRARCFFCNE